MDGLNRFKDAQAAEHDGLDTALAEIRRGRKRGHWIWYVFPQLEGLGTSATSRRFGLRGLEEASAYLRDDDLRTALCSAIDAVSEQLCKLQPPRLEELMGSRVDAQKLVSSLTLFERAAEELNATEPSDEYARLAERAGEVLATAEAQGYERCAFTRERLADA